ncbi:hypothetical protein BJV82DRAFT_575641 [Fennellomyces sp. T-0311]|nr:hypothetical protein BJV82DRAFT_575641 [Fennellomyces sp. T-0311]
MNKFNQMVLIAVLNLILLLLGHKPYLSDLTLWNSQPTAATTTPRDDPIVVDEERSDHDASISTRTPDTDFTPYAEFRRQVPGMAKDFFRSPLPESDRRRFLAECPRNVDRVYTAPLSTMSKLEPLQSAQTLSSWTYNIDSPVLQDPSTILSTEFYAMMESRLTLPLSLPIPNSRHCSTAHTSDTSSPS